jgi:hypothetical protein
MDRCRLWGPEGDAFNAILAAAGMNFRKLPAHAAVLLCLGPKPSPFALVVAWLIAGFKARRMPAPIPLIG